MKNVVAIIEKASDGRYSIFSDDDNLPFLLTGTGATVAEAYDVFLGGYLDMKRIFEEDGKEFEELSFEFRYDVPSFLQQYAYALTLAGLERITGVSQKQLSHYINGVRKPSKATTKKIEDKLKAFGNEIASVRFI